MDLQIPRELRAALYVLTVIGSPVIAYLNVIGIIGANEVALWSAVTTAVAGMAALNLTPKDKE